MTALLEIIEELREEHGSINAAARAIGMPQATLHNLARGADPSIESLRLIDESTQRAPLEARPEA